MKRHKKLLKINSSIIPIKILLIIADAIFIFAPENKYGKLARGTRKRRKCALKKLSHSHTHIPKYDNVSFFLIIQNTIANTKNVLIISAKISFAFNVPIKIPQTSAIDT